MGIATSLLCACGDKSKGSATEQAAADFAEIKQLPLDPQDPMDKEWLDVLEHFTKHMDVHYKSHHTQLTILHLAAIFNKAELVRCLLLDGADPNARTQFFDNADTAIEMALTDISRVGEQQSGKTEIIATIDTLLKGGAKPEADKDIVINAIALCDYEEVALHLLQKLPTEKLREEEAYLAAAWKGWTTVLEFLHRTHTLQKQQLEKALITATAGAYRLDGQHAQCIQQLLQLGANINAQDEAGRTPVFAAAAVLLQTEAEESVRMLDIIDLLLQRGADITLSSQDEEYPDCSAYDILRMHPTALSDLEKRGHVFQAPPLIFTAGDISLLSNICKAKQRGQAVEETRKHYNAIASALSPTPEMKESAIYPEALENAILLLSQVDCAKTAQLLASLPMWQDVDIWQQHEHTTQAVISAIRNAPELVLPPQLLQDTAQSLAKLHMNDEAATLIEWLGRDTTALPSIQQLMQDPTPAIQAGAWTANLALRDLPAPRDGEIRRWIEKHPKLNLNNPALQKALLLTSLEELWYGNMPPQRQKQLISAMREIGAPCAAAQYEKIAKNIHDAEVLDTIMTQDDDWKFELEIATAQFILQNEHAFRVSIQQNTD